MFSDDFDITRTTDVLCVCGMCVWCGCVFVCVCVCCMCVCACGVISF